MANVPRACCLLVAADDRFSSILLEADTPTKGSPMGARSCRLFMFLPVLVLSCSSAPQPAAPPAGAAALAGSTIYEVFVRDFSPRGDLRGVIEGLERIEAAGADIVWLMPIQPIGELHRKGPLGSPYSIRDYRGINPDFGTADDFRALVRAVHARGMRLILDWVPNHTAWDHAWVQAYPDYYTRDAAGRMTVPRDNDGGLTDWTDVVELDYDSPRLRAAMIADMLHWLEEHGIDGFRVDVAGMVPDAFWREAIPVLRPAGASILLAEWGDPKMHELGFDLTYGWDSYHRLKEVWRGAPASAWVAAELADLAALPRNGLRLRFTTNHDETAWDEPPVALFDGAAGARAAYAATALLPGTRLIYNGQEVESPQKLGLFVQEAVAWDQPQAEEARAFYRAVNELARTHDAFTAGSTEAVATNEPGSVVAYRRGGVLVLVNVRAAPVMVEPQAPGMDGARDLLSGARQDGTTVALPPYGVAVLEPAAR
jgi:glycosidase